MVTETRALHQDGEVGPTSLPIDHYVAAIRSDAALLADAARLAGPDAPVPTCPEWTVGDLVRHLGGVQRWATRLRRRRAPEVWAVELDEVVGARGRTTTRWSTGSRPAPSRWRWRSSRPIPTLQCWTFLRATSPLAMWARRQAHETAIHRVDAELAAGPGTSGFDPSFAADGIDELLTCFIVRSRTGLRADSGAHDAGRRRRRATATGRSLIGPDGVVTEPGSPGADAEVRGEASDLYQVLWNRRETRGFRAPEGFVRPSGTQTPG